MEITFRVLDLSEIEKVEAFEKKLLRTLNISEEEATLLSWSAPWRRESLEFYLPKGWCFAAWKGEELVGYFLAQPMIFFRGNTQTLWVEYLTSTEDFITEQLLDIARKYGRDKHLQCVLFADDKNTLAPLQKMGAKPIADGILQINTTRVGR